MFFTLRKRSEIYQLNQPLRVIGDSLALVAMGSLSLSSICKCLKIVKMANVALECELL